jgi:hypothetical protein
MSFSPDEVRTAIAVVALVLSFISLYFTRVNWVQSNRPVVSAFLVEHQPGNAFTAFNLVVSNTGSRPAVRVRLHASRADIVRLLLPDAEQARLEHIECCFLNESEVPLLRNGEELSTSFGGVSVDALNGPWLNYGSEIEISISYQDLDGRRFESRQPLKIYARDGFGGGVWSEPKK